MALWQSCVLRNACEETFIYIVLNILTIKQGNISFCGYLIIFALFLHNLEPGFFFSWYFANISTGSSKLTDLRQEVFNCLTDKIAGRSKQHETETGVCRRSRTKLTQHLKQPEVSCHNLKLDPFNVARQAPFENIRSPPMSFLEDLWRASGCSTITLP